MSVILHIDTAIDTATISIAQGGKILAELSNPEQKDHAGFLQPAIHTIVTNAGLGLNDIDAIAVSAGPGSYTGLRVGMASAKGLSFALNKPLITIGSLEILTYAAINETVSEDMVPGMLFCPMIDARRMEVFAALYDRELNVILPPSAVILNEKSFANWLLKNKICFFGNGAKKWKNICSHNNARFLYPQSNSLAMSNLAFQKFANKEFADNAYVEPLYIKEFHGGPSKS